MSTLTKPAVNASHGDAGGRYAQMRDSGRVHERALFVLPRIPSELELQARWFAGDFGRKFVSTDGDHIDIVQFGVWNRETGPDFRDAAIRINSGEAIHGSIEIDLLDRNWESHGHATNPVFETTVLHLFVERSDRAFLTRPGQLPWHRLNTNFHEPMLSVLLVFFERTQREGRGEHLFLSKSSVSTQ